MLTNPDNLNNLVPICPNSKLALDFIQATDFMPIANELVATVAIVYTTAATITKTSNIQVNAGPSVVIAEFVRYIVSNTNNDNISFIIPFMYGSVRHSRRIRWTMKQRIQIKLDTTEQLFFEV